MKCIYEKKNEKQLLKKGEILYHNIFTFSQKILNDRLLLAITSKKKKKLSSRFKLKPITTYHLKFIVKIL